MHNSSILFALQWCIVPSVQSVAVTVPKGPQGYLLAETVALSETVRAERYRPCTEIRHDPCLITKVLSRYNINHHTVAAWVTLAVHLQLLNQVPLRRVQEGIRT